MDKFTMQELNESSSYIRSNLDDIKEYRAEHKEAIGKNEPEYVHLLYSVFVSLKYFIDLIMTNIGTNTLVCDTRSNKENPIRFNTMIVLYLSLESDLMYKDSYGEYLFDDIHLKVSPFDIYNGLINVITDKLGDI